MERFGQFRDKATSIAPFLPIPTDPSGIYLPLHCFLFAFRIPLLFTFFLTYFCFIQWFPVGALVKKGYLWCILGTPGIWWMDLQVDGVRKGTVAQNIERLPQSGSIIASSSASPIDPLYLAAIFDPIFTASYPNTRKVQQISLIKAVFGAFASPALEPSSRATLVDLATLVKQNPNRTIVVFPECTTSNGRGVLPLSPCLLGTPSNAKIFPVSLRYTPPDITTPIPHSYLTFLWNLCSKPSHSIRIRIAEAVFNTARRQDAATARTSSYNTNFFDTFAADGSASDAETLVGSEDSTEGPATQEEKAVLDKTAEALARLGRTKRVSLGVKNKVDFLAMWNKSKRR